MRQRAGEALKHLIRSFFWSLGMESVERLMEDRLRMLLRGLRPSKVRRFLRAFAESSSDIVFVQIGANDGKTDDPIFDLVLREGWHGVLVEPVPYLFDALQRNYHERRDRLAFENVAISDHEETKKLYYISAASSALPPWIRGINSFSREHVLWQQRAFPDLAGAVEEMDVQCITLRDVISRNRISAIDLLLVDVEGFDYEVIKQISDEDVLPRIVVFEHKCLDESRRTLAFTHLRKYGYEIFCDHADAVCILHDASTSRSAKLVGVALALFGRSVAP